MNVRVRREQPQDVDAIHAVTAGAFLNAPHTSHTEQFIVSGLRNAGALAVSLVAEVDGLVVGHVAASPVAITDGSPGWFGVGPVSVHPDYQGRGVGSRLMESVLDELRALNAAGCVVLGDPAYYARFGFRPEPQLVLANVPPKYFQALAFGPSLPRGFATYHAAFDALE